MVHLNPEEPKLKAWSATGFISPANVELTFLVAVPTVRPEELTTSNSSVPTCNNLLPTPSMSKPLLFPPLEIVKPQSFEL